MKSRNFANQLCMNDIDIFLGIIGFKNWEYVKHTDNNENGYLTAEFVYDRKKYIFEYSDFTAKVTRVLHKHFLSIYQEMYIVDSWLIYMANKFGIEYIDTYTKLNGIKHIHFLQKIKSSDFKLIVHEIRKNNSRLVDNTIISDSDDLYEITNNFFYHERWFAVVRKKSYTNNNYFSIFDIVYYIHFSDFGITYPLIIKNNIYLEYMTKTFGNEYLEAYKEYMQKQIEEVYVPKYIAECEARVEKRIDCIKKAISKEQNGKSKN